MPGRRRWRRPPSSASAPISPPSPANTACRSASSFAASGLLTFVIGIALGFPALRVQKHYLAFVTLAFSVLCWLVFRNETAVTGGVMGMRDIERPVLFGLKLRRAVDFYWFVLAITAVMTFVLWWIVRSPWGRAFAALRENPLRAESLGVDVRLYTLLAFALGSAYGGMAGSLYAPLVEFIDPSPFALGPSLLFMLMVVIGGSGTFLGPFVGAGIAVLLPEWLRAWETWYLLIYAVLVMVMMAAVPGRDRRTDASACFAREGAHHDAPGSKCATSPSRSAACRRCAA